MSIYKRLKLEHINAATGVCLCIAGITYFLQNDTTSALSWGIFGAMYLVMDSYKPCPAHQRTTGHRLREVFGIVGFVLSLILLAHLFFTQ